MLGRLFAPGHRCPVCRSRRFRDARGRRKARCDRCGTPERGRAMWLCLERLGLLVPGLTVLHLAPERGLARRLHDLYGDGYHPADVDPERYHRRLGLPVSALDLCRDLARIPTGIYDLILHNHVLEHIACPVVPVLEELGRIIRPGGHHLFSVPIQGERTVEAPSPELTPEERKERFGQHDHMRLFGADLARVLQRLWGRHDVYVDVLKVVGAAELERAAVPLPKERPDGHTVFWWRKPIVAGSSPAGRAERIPSDRKPDAPRRPRGRR